MTENRPFSGFMNHDYVLSFRVADTARRQKLLELCEGPWQGDELIAEHTWEVSNELSPADMEKALLEIIDEGDQAVYYYLTPPLSSGMPGTPEAKRIFSVNIA